ncbi:ABC transporter substrate-binding protein [Microbacterium sp. KNMS]
MNKNTRSLFLLAAAAAAVTSVTGCTSGDAETAAGPEEIASIGLMVQDMSNPFFAAMEKGAKEAAEEIGATVNVQDAQLDLANQNTQIDAFIQQNVDLIVISAVDEAGIEPAIERAKRAGIIVIAVDTPAKGADVVVMTDAVEAGEISCRYLFEQMGGSGELLIVDGTPIQTITDRITGCEKALEDYPDIEVVGHQNSKNDRATGLAVTTDMLTATPTATGIFGMNDPSALGAVLAVEQAGLTDQVVVTGVDGSPEAVDELQRDGSPFVGTATQNPAEMVRQAVAVAQGIVAGEEPEESTVLIPSELVTRENVSDYPGW